MEQQKINSAQDKLVYRLIIGVSIFVFLVVVILNRKILPVPAVLPSFTYYLPLLNAVLNGTCSLLLLLSLYFISRKNIAMHKRINIAAFILSSLFLVSYIIFHYLAPETRYGDLNGDHLVSEMEKAAVGSLRYVYYTILITHIILAAIVLPLILFSFNFGLRNQIIKHKKLVRWTWPIWFYVTVTGVVVYLMISPYYQF
jgi:putative membrane protein